MKTKDSYYLLDNEVRYYPASQQVLHGDEVIHLTDFQHKLLMNFIEHPGQIRTQAQISEQVWPNKITTVDAFNKPLGAVRNALGNHQKSKKNHFIKTWSREGYSLVCSCEFIAAPTPASHVRSWLRPLAFVLLAVIITTLILKQFDTQSTYQTVNLRRLTPLDGIAADPSLSDDGSVVAFTFDDGEGRGQILAKALSNRDHVVLTQGHNDKMPSISPSGDRLLYQRLEDGQCQIRMITFAEQLTVAEDKMLIHCSPSSFYVSMSWHDSNSFYYTDASKEFGPYSIYRFDLDTLLSTLYLSPEVKVDKQHNGFARVLYHRKNDKLYIIHSPDWLNSEIYVYHQEQLTKLTSVDIPIGSLGIYKDDIVYKDRRNRLVTGVERKPLTTEFNRPLLHPVTSQMSNILAYYLGPIFQWDIYSYDIQSTETQQLTFKNAQNRYPVKVNEYFYFASDFTGINQIYRTGQTPGAQPQQISNFNQDNKISQVTVSNDGKFIAISYDEATELYQINGNSLTQIKRFERHIYPAFSPDNQRVLLSQFQKNGQTRVIEYRLKDNRATGLTISEARFALYHERGIVFSKYGKKGIHLYIDGVTQALQTEVEVFKPIHVALAHDSLYVIDRSEKEDKRVKKMSIQGEDLGRLPIENAGQLHFAQGKLYYTMENRGKTSIYVGEIIEQ